MEIFNFCLILAERRPSQTWSFDSDSYLQTEGKYGQNKSAFINPILVSGPILYPLKAFGFLVFSGCID